jgi:hypothetical protein
MRMNGGCRNVAAENREGACFSALIFRVLAWYVSTRRDTHRLKRIPLNPRFFARDELWGSVAATKTFVLIPGRPINNRPQVNNLPHIAAKPLCATIGPSKVFKARHRSGDLCHGARCPSAKRGCRAFACEPGVWTASCRGAPRRRWGRQPSSGFSREWLRSPAAPRRQEPPANSRCRDCSLAALRRGGAVRQSAP